ncbi:MAG: hypothetical protein ACU85U_04735 [Gammaproteobacteria bacterium]
MNGKTVDPVTEQLAGSAMGRLAEFETLERHAIRCVFKAACSGVTVADDYLELARDVLVRRALQ